MLIVSILTGCGQPEPITKGQMLVAQIQFSEYLMPVTNQMTDIYSDYIAYNISEKKFKEEVKNCIKLIESIDKQYKTFNKKYILAPEEQGEDIRNAISSIEGARSEVKAILEHSIIQGRALEREKLLQLYMGGCEDIQNYLDDFEEIAQELLDGREEVEESEAGEEKPQDAK